MKTALAKKIGMTSLFNENGAVDGVTALQIDHCVVSQIRTVDNDGYATVQLGSGQKLHPNRPSTGHAKKAGIENAPLALREVRISAADEFTLGQVINADMFQVGDEVDVRGVTQGKGFAGTIKRHNFGRGPESHGHDHHRAPGSIGASARPGHVTKGKRMSGRMGNDNVTIQNVEILRIDTENNIIFVRGSVPGKKNGLVQIRQAIKGKA